MKTEIKLLQKYFTSGFFLNAPVVIMTIITLITLPIILANIAISHYGKWQFVIALQVWLAVFTAANITLSSKKGIAQNLDGTFLYAFLTRLRLIVPVGIIVIGVAFYLRVLGQHIFSALLIILGLYLILGYLFQISFCEFLIAKKKFKEWSFWQILTSSVAIIGSTIVALTTKNIVYFALFQLGSISVFSWIAWSRVVKKGNLIESYKNREIDKECVPFGLKLIPVGIVTITANKISHFIIGPFLGFANLAVFSLADNLWNRSAGTIKSTRPLLYADFAKIGRETLIQTLNRRLMKVGLIGIPLTLTLVLAGWSYIRFFLPQEFQQAIVYFAILALGLPAQTLAIILHTALEAHFRYKELTVIGIIPNLLRITLILIFGYLWQIIGICIAMAISGWISLCFYYLLTLKSELAGRIMSNLPLLKKLSPRYIYMYGRSEDAES